MARLLLLFGSDVGRVNKQGDSPIIVASRENHVDIVRLLIVDGSNINCHNKVRCVSNVTQYMYAIDVQTRVVLEIMYCSLATLLSWFHAKVEIVN